jgi:hypothetical protein
MENWNDNVEFDDAAFDDDGPIIFYKFLRGSMVTFAQFKVLVDSRDMPYYIDMEGQWVYIDDDMANEVTVEIDSVEYDDH